MVSTTMHFMPGCVILRSYNLIDWEIVTYVYETLECTDEECMRNGKNAYGRGCGPLRCAIIRAFSIFVLWQMILEKRICSAQKNSGALDKK